MITTNKVMSWIVICLILLVFWGSGATHETKVEVLLVLILAHVLMCSEDTRDMWKGRKP